jgi:hypothetical protein
MPAPGNLGRIRGLRRVFLAPLTTDTSALTAYGTAIQLGGFSELTFSEDEEVYDLKTTLGIENSDSQVMSITWGIKFQEKNLAVQDLARNGKLLADATNGKNIFAYTGGRPQQFGIFAQPQLVEGGPADYYIALMKCKVEKNPGKTLGAQWQQQDLAGRAFYTLKDHLLWGEAFLNAITDITADVALADLQSAIATGT